MKQLVVGGSFLFLYSVYLKYFLKYSVYFVFYNTNLKCFLNNNSFKCLFKERFDLKMCFSYFLSYIYIQTGSLKTVGQNDIPSRNPVFCVLSGHFFENLREPDASSS